jgi:germination protein M
VTPPRRAAAVIALTAVAAALGWLLFVGVPRWYAARSASAPAVAVPAAPVEVGRKIKVRLFYVSEDGARLTGVDREVPFGEGTDQAREIITAQVAPVAEPFVSAIPSGTRLRSLFITTHGEAYVDLSREVTSAHPGGTLNEILTVYTIVNALTANLPAVQSVKILVDGKETPTLAGHVDLARPLVKNLTWVQ